LPPIYLASPKKFPRSANKAAKMFDFLLLNDTTLFLHKKVNKKLAVKSFRELTT
jgi:hypothetical protein